MDRFTGHWNAIFAAAHLTSGPGRPSLKIQNINPKPSAGSRNIFEDDEREILAAARAHGFMVVSEPKSKIHSFVKLSVK